MGRLGQVSRAQVEVGNLIVDGCGNCRANHYLHVLPTGIIFGSTAYGKKFKKNKEINAGSL